MSKSPSLQLVFHDALDNRSTKSPPLYTTSQVVKGKLGIYGCPSNDFVVKLTFTGNLFNRISFPHRNYVKPPDLSLKQITYECAIVHQSSSSSIFENDGPDCRTIPFRFPLDRRFLRASEETSGRNADELFPPSILVNSLKPGERGAYCHVTYTVKAAIICKDMKPVTINKEVRIVDETTSPSPPICVSDFGAEYICEQARTLKNKIGLPQGRLLITAAEPSPIEIFEGGHRAMANVPVRLSFTGATSGTTQKNWSASVEWALKASTFISTVAMRSTPTYEQAQRAIFMRHAETTISSGQRKMLLTNWKQKPGAQPAWELDSSLWLGVIPEHCPPPTFSSHFLSRRYFISLQLRVSGEGSAVFELQVPVQINFPGGGVPPSRRSSHSTTCSLPQYVR